MTTGNDTWLVLWDIDHTLIDSAGLGHDVYERIFPAVTGQPLRELAALHGRTELDIMRATLLQHDIEPSEQLLRELADALADGFRAASGELAQRGQVLPGVRAALESLHPESAVHQSLLTGNTRAVARVKTEVFGLDRYLDLATGAYGDDHADRSELVGIAGERAARQLSTEIPADRTVLIGDTPRDVRAARSAGARAVAVASGVYPIADLREAGADIALESLVDPRQLHRALDR